MVGVMLPQDTARQAGRPNLRSGLDRGRHRRCCGLVQPRPRDGISGAGSVRGQPLRPPSRHDSSGTQCRRATYNAMHSDVHPDAIVEASDHTEAAADAKAREAAARVAGAPSYPN